MAKRLMSVLCAVILSVGIGVSALAAPSISINGIVTGVANAVDAFGDYVKVIVESLSDAEFTEDEKAAVAELRQNYVKMLKQLLGDRYRSGMVIADIKNVRIEGNEAKVDFPVTVTFNMTGVTKKSTVELLHYTAEQGKWEVIHGEVGNGTVQATFDSLSPVAFVVDSETAKAMHGVSPKTGNLPVITGAGAAALISAAGMILVRRKRKTV